MEDKNNDSSNNSVLLYNTQNIDAEVLKSGFSIRKREYDRIWKDIRRCEMTHPETHYLIQGVRGAGKTTLLSRLAYEVTADEKLSKWLVPILLNEEEYGILSLFTFWLRIAEKLAEQNSNLYADLFEQVSKLDDSAEMAWELIQSNLDKNEQKIIVFVDNLGELFKDFDGIEHAQLRKVLSLHSQIRLVGGSSQLLEAHFDVSEPFYQFFKLVNLKPINEAEMHELLRSLAKQTSEEAVKTIEEIITEHPERIEAVRRLTDGVPRTVVLLFQIIIEGAKESSYAYLEETIDKTTPLYKHRMDDLSRQQKAIVHAIAMNWDAMSTKEIAEQTRLPSKTVSAQLVKLQKQWIIVKVETNTKNHLYLIKERFFNIWYLMRYGNQTDKRRVLWLTRFLESWHSKNELTIKLLDIVMPYIDLKKDNETDIVKRQAIYINALLASKFINEDFKEKVNEYLEPFYDNLIKNNASTMFIEEFKYFLSSFNLDDTSSAKQDLEKLLKLDIGIGSCLLCLEVVYRISENNQELKNLIINKVLGISLISKMNYIFLIMSIMNSNSKTINELGDYIVVNFINKRNLDDPENIDNLIFKAYVKLWLEDWSDFYDSLKRLKNNSLNFKDDPFEFELFERLLILLLKKNQLEILYELMNSFNHLKEQFKPIYYATVSLLKDERQQEYLRMGPELQGTVDEILQKVEDYRVKYA